MNREPGNYWIKKYKNSEWEIAYYRGYLFKEWIRFIPGRRKPFYDSDFYIIDERRIEREPENITNQYDRYLQEYFSEFDFV
jgi:hypothetical protein